ncbi:hypothetical protein SPRG_22282 [Saprolegnia parasitica CBS 223.65]|uniref:Uncharacterized protein n=1 Tax=Saprolegnia parasitica (strain CBS 223.65) TaxID=695850 RepID=A0A067C9A7_SAPPC|nr:hypothetical protein SPRG_22282 [Saprolegnia parasitica CBS 223.65]KDO23402.1 hypothetical protein SPRG_22282 [Saprolegnia parasitica CBS 223.65]|eukprot:XP_012205935.1 hypothetical protein SPRG_22282 [Saprolegnia parasitica CBS 223.65]
MKPRMLQLPMAFSTKREIRRLHVEDRFSEVVVHNGTVEVVVHNGTVYLSGQLADDLDGGIAAQTAETLASIDQFLADAGTDKSRILSVTIYLKDMADYAGMNAVWDAWVVKGATPARATVQSALYDPKVLVEMSVVAAL